METPRKTLIKIVMQNMPVTFLLKSNLVTFPVNFIGDVFIEL
jgi:hypothetical protein